MSLTPILSVLLIAAAVWAIVRGADVRLVLAAAALAVGAAAGDVAPVVREFLATFSNEKFVVPICSAMGFAYVLRHTGCERHLVLLLVRPLRHAGGLLVPGVVVVGFLVNVPVVSQTSTAICLGPVVIPLMRSAGYSPPAVGACLLLGASVGGELLNPGAPELLTVSDRTGVPPTELARRYVPPLVFPQLAVSAAVLWLTTAWRERRGAAAPGGEPDAGAAGPERVDLLKACVPLVPLGLLFAAGLPAPYTLFEVPDAWVVLPAGGRRDPAYASRLIGLAMLLGVAAAAAAAPAKAGACVRQFFDGAGYGFAHIVSLIVTASGFAAAVRGSGLAAELGRAIEAFPRLLDPLAAAVPLAFAAVSGSGMASTQGLFGAFDAPAAAVGADRAAVGGLVSLASAAGRTMSPVAAVVLMCASLTGTRPVELVRRVSPPLLVGLGAVVALRAAGCL